MTPCVLCHLDFDIDLPENDQIQVSVTGTCLGIGEPPLPSNLAGLAAIGKSAEELMFELEINPNNKNPGSKASSKASSLRNSLELPDRLAAPGLVPTPKQSPLQAKRSPLQCAGLAAWRNDAKIKYHTKKQYAPSVELSRLSYLPSASIHSHLGHLNFFIVRESTSVKEEGGLNGFLHSFIAEMMCICRAHVFALGGNALVTYQMSECVVDANIHKNQSQCLVNVYGDVVHVVYDTEAPQPLSLNTNVKT